MIRANDPSRKALHLDGYSVQGSTCLFDVTHIERVVRESARIAGMRILNLTTAHITKDLARLNADAFEDEGGFSTLALISTSHIALHVWPERAKFMFDLVSCRGFDHIAVTEHVRKQLACATVTEHALIGFAPPMLPTVSELQREQTGMQRRE